MRSNTCTDCSLPHATQCVAVQGAGGRLPTSHRDIVLLLRPGGGSSAQTPPPLALLFAVLRTVSVSAPVGVLTSPIGEPPPGCPSPPLVHLRRPVDSGPRQAPVYSLTIGIAPIRCLRPRAGEA